ncbi:MAG: hypothetical protein K5686_07920 [Lachnospiraceae bacterium]|nr:hypothetical protein [Lachnospiraceae bacterium]
MKGSTVNAKIKKKEDTAINDYKEELKKQKNELEKLITLARKRIKSQTATDERVISYSKRKKHYQYYLIEKDRTRVYVKKDDSEIIRKKMQAAYDNAVYDRITKMHRQLSRFLENYDYESIRALYDDMSDARKCFVTPIMQTNEEFIQQWKKKHPGNQNNYFEEGLFPTDKGEYVRSKSEKILADLFFKNKIPYSYEPCFELSNGSFLYPDFVLLNVRKRKTVFWEHFGLISDAEYSKKTVWKLSMYEKHGLRIGDDLLFSMESEDMPLDIRQLEHKIREYLL